MSDTSPPSRHHARLAVIILAIIALGAAGWWFSHQSANNNDKTRKNGAPIAVGIASVQQQDAPLQLSALGTATASYTVTVHSRVDGQLNKLHFEEGQLVKQGQLLAEIDPRPYQAALAQVQGQLMRDQALLKNAELDLARYRQLAEQNSIAKQQVDTQEALVHQYQGTVKLDQGAVDNAKLQLDYTRITAPISARAGLRQVDPGNIVHAADANGLVILTQTQPINVVFAIPEVSLSQVQQAITTDKTLQVEAWDRDNRNKLADGKLLAMDNQLNTSTGTVNIKARFDNQSQQLYPNQFVNVHLQLGVQTAAIVIPTVAIQQGKVGSYVYSVNPDQTVSISKIKTGLASGDNTIVEQGLRPGQKIVIDGLDKLRDGASVKIIDRNTQANTGSDTPNGQPRHKHAANVATGHGTGKHQNTSRAQ